jgi:hypothetical protein
MLGKMGLSEELDSAAQAASAFADGDELLGVIPAEAEPGERRYVCAYGREEEQSWLVLDGALDPVTDREAVRRAASIVAMCELAEESAGGGELDELRERLMAVRLTESPPGIEEAEEAALNLQRAVGSPPRVAEPSYLDRVGAATRRLEQALGDPGSSPFAAAMQAGIATVEEFLHDVESNYRLPLG